MYSKLLHKSRGSHFFQFWYDIACTVRTKAYACSASRVIMCFHSHLRSFVKLESFWSWYLCITNFTAEHCSMSGLEWRRCAIIQNRVYGYVAFSENLRLGFPTVTVLVVGLRACIDFRGWSASSDSLFGLEMALEQLPKKTYLQIRLKCGSRVQYKMKLNAKFVVCRVFATLAAM